VNDANVLHQLVPWYWAGYGRKPLWIAMPDWTKPDLWNALRIIRYSRWKDLLATYLVGIVEADGGIGGCSNQWCWIGPGGMSDDYEMSDLLYLLIHEAVHARQQALWSPSIAIELRERDACELAAEAFNLIGFDDELRAWYAKECLYTRWWEKAKSRRLSFSVSDF